MAILSGMWEPLLVIAVATVVIWWFSGRLEAVAHTIGEHLSMPASVKGAVLYAIPSSFPELATATMAVMAQGDEPVFEVGIGTIAGSAVFNLLLIPAFAVIVAVRHAKARGQRMEGIRISQHVFLRDGIFYLFVVGAFLGVALSGTFSKVAAVAFLALYALYVVVLYVDTRRHRAALAGDSAEGAQARETGSGEDERMSLPAALTWLFVSVGALGVACYFLVEATIEVSREHLDVPPYVVAVILTAAATSIPDLLISVASARKSGEEAEEAIVNAFSSNIFDVLVCLSIPALLFPDVIHLEVRESVVSLVLLAVTTVITLVLCKSGNRLTVGEAWVLVGLYFAFVASAVFNDEVLALFGA